MNDVRTGRAVAPGLVLRPAEEADLAAIAAIYAHHVETGAASFELEPPGRAEMLRRWRAIVEGGYPYLSALEDGEVVGYAYASAYRTRPAYRHTVENSVYVRADQHGRGVGRLLLAQLIDDCAGRGFGHMIGVMG